MAGRRPVAEAFAALRPSRRLLVVPERRAALEQLVLHATSLRIPVVEVEGGTLTQICGFDGHQGVALVVEPRHWATLDEVLGRARERGEPPFVLVLDSLEDPQNVGTLLRSAEACGVHGVLFPTRRSAPISPAAIKASAGAIEHLLLVPLDDLGGGLVDLRGRGLRIVGADEEAALPFRDADFRGPLAIVVGSEGQGISGPIRRRIDLAVRIPMRGQVASLNASVAGSVLLFEASAQRGPAAAPPGPRARPQPTSTVSTAVESPAPAKAAEAPAPAEAVEAAKAAAPAEAVEAAEAAAPATQPAAGESPQPAIRPTPTRPRSTTLASGAPVRGRRKQAGGATAKPSATDEAVSPAAPSTDRPPADATAGSPVAPSTDSPAAATVDPPAPATADSPAVARSGGDPESDDLLPELSPAATPAPAPDESTGGDQPA